MKRILYEVYGASAEKRALIERETIKIDLLATSVDTQAAGSKQKAREGLITQNNFVKYAEKHPTMLWPVYTMQRQLQMRLGGVGFWKQATQQRQERAQQNTALQYGNFKSVISTIQRQSSRFVALPATEEDGNKSSAGVVAKDSAKSPSLPGVDDDARSQGSIGSTGGRLGRLRSRKSSRRISTGNQDAMAVASKTQESAYGSF